MRLVDTGAAQFDQFASHGFKRREVKFLGAIIPKIRGGHATGLQAIRADDLAARLVFDEKMIADSVKRIGVAPGDE